MTAEVNLSDFKKTQTTETTSATYDVLDATHVSIFGIVTPFRVSGFKVPRLKSTESTSTGEKILKNHHFSPIFQERINDKISFKKDVESRIQSAQLRSSAIMDNLINAESHAKHEMRQPKEYEKI